MSELPCIATRTLYAIALALVLLGANTPRADEPTATPTGGLRWSDGLLDLHVGGIFAFDGVKYDSENRRGSRLRTDIAELLFEGRVGEAWRVRIAPDLEGTDTRFNLDEAWVAWQGVPWLRVTAGLVELPLGLESGIREEDLSFVGHSFAHWLSFRTDIALRAEGEHWDGLVSWDASISAGNGFDRDGKKRGDPRLTLRGGVYPFRWLDDEPDASAAAKLAAGLFVGGGYERGPDFDGELDVRNPLDTKLFQTGELDADWHHFYSAWFGIDAGPVRFFYEGVQGGIFDVETPFGEQDLDNQIDSWQATLSWMITGQHYDSRIFRLREQAPRGPAAGSAGAFWPGEWEIALRYANADIDRDFFDFGLTNYVASSQEFRSFTAALNWYATANLRATAEVVATHADQDPAELGFQGDDLSGVLRVQWRF